MGMKKSVVAIMQSVSDTFQTAASSVGFRPYQKPWKRCADLLREKLLEHGWC